MNIKLSNHALLILRGILARPGWATGIEDIVLGGGLLVKLPTPAPVFTDESKTAVLNSWLEEIGEYPMTEKENTSCQVALRAHAAAALPPGPVALELIAAFAIGPK